MSALDKLKAVLHVGSLDLKEKINIEICFTDKSFIINFIDPLKDLTLQEIKESFFPFISEDNRIIKMNYIYIKTIYLDGAKLLKFTLYNPLTSSLFTIIFNHFKFTKKKLFSNSSPSASFMHSMILEVKKRQKVQIIKSISNFINMIHIFHQFISTGRKYNKIINDLFMKAFVFGMIYYEKNKKEFKLNQEIKNTLPKYVNAEINKIIKEKESQPPEQINQNNSTDIDRKTDNQNLENEDPKVFTFDIDSIYQKDLFQNYPAYGKFSDDIKKMTSYYTEMTINVIYQIFNLDIEELNKNNVINQTINGMIINRYNNMSYMEQSEFIHDINISQNNYLMNSNMNSESEEKINKLFQLCKEFHSFFPNNSMENIVNNTSQIIQRKFFELLFKHFFSDIFLIEVGKNKTLSPDEFHQILKILRRAKKILFNNKNLEYYKEFEFLNEEIGD